MTFLRVDAQLKKLARYLQPFFLEPPPNVAARGLAGLMELLRIAKRVHRISGDEIAELTAFLTGSLGDFLDRNYESEAVSVAAYDAGNQIEFRGQAKFAATVFDDLTRTNHCPQPIDEHRPQALSLEAEVRKNPVCFSRFARGFEVVQQLVSTGDRVLVGFALP